MAKPGPIPPDAHLVRAARGGDREAFGQLIERHFGLVHTIAFARLGEREAAEDLAQEVFLRAFLCLDQLRETERFVSWLAQITRNLAINWIRSRRRSSRLVRMVPLEGMPGHVADTRVQGVVEAMASQDESRALQEAILHLPPDLREVVMLHWT